MTKVEALGVKLAGKCTEVLDKECTCNYDYIDRNRQDPSCEYCDVGKHLWPLVNQILKESKRGT